MVVIGCAARIDDTHSAARSPASTHTARLASPSQKRHTLPDAGITRATCGARGRVVTFRVSVESGLPTTPAVFGNAVRMVLCDRRSWIGSGAVRFRYDPAGSLLIGLRSPGSTEVRCLQLVRLSVDRTYSCGTPREVVINSARWFMGTSVWPGPLPAYRAMLVNHETGHALGLGHRTCPAPGSPAPVMMQQSKGLTTLGGHTCAPNAWPLPDEWERLS